MHQPVDLEKAQNIARLAFLALRALRTRRIALILATRVEAAVQISGPDAEIAHESVPELSELGSPRDGFDYFFAITDSEAG